MRLLLLLALVATGSRVTAQEMVSVSQSAVTMTATSGPTSNATTTLTWRGNFFSRTKITVSTSTFSQRYALTVEAQNAQRGRSAGVVTLVSGAAARDLVTDISSGFLWLIQTGQATLRYVATPLPGSPGGSETHTVTYTILQQ